VSIVLKKIDHVAVCVPSLDQALARYGELFGLKGVDRDHSAALETEAVLLPVGESSIELISPYPTVSSGILSRFLERRGPGIHHIAIEVEGLDAALALLKTLGVPLIDETPRIGARGHRIAFISPKATGGVLIELVEPIETAQ
jgi:methylmalonyl-CoA/ethylmalonyl-CoA epimerase